MKRMAWTLPESRRSISRTRLFSWVMLFTLVLETTAVAGPGTSITPSGLGTDVPAPADNVYNINGGTIAVGPSGSNLFHSFGDFSIGAGDIARFNNTTGIQNISNVLSRVTGENSSNIDGTIQSAIDGANFFFINPNGIVFGPNASLQISGSVHFSTANYISLSDGVTFGMVATSGTLTAAPVSAFGFLGLTQASIVVQGSQLSVPTGQTLSLVGNGIEIKAGVLDNGTLQTARLSAPSGQINLASVSSPSEVSLSNLDTSPIGGSATVAYAPVNMSEGTVIDVSGSPAGTIRIRSGEFVLDRAFLTNTHSGDGTVGEIAIGADSITVSGGAQIVSTNDGSSPGPSITLTAKDTLTISGFDTEGTLTGIDPNGTGLTPSGVFTSTTAEGDGGHILITRLSDATQGPMVTIQDGAWIRSSASGTGPGGNITVTEVKSIDVLSGGQISSVSGAFDFETGEIIGSGNGGAISLKADESVKIAGAQLDDLFQASQISAGTLTSGIGGNIFIAAPKVTVEDSGVIASSASGTGTGGAITISDFNQLTISGFSPDFLNSTIQSSTSSGAGPGGDILLTSASGEIAIDQLGLIRSDNSGASVAGNITINGKSITVQEGGGIESRVTADGESGKITLDATGSVIVTGQVVDPLHPNAVVRSHVSNESSSTGVNQGIHIHATDVTVIDGGRIESQTRDGSGGEIGIAADRRITVGGPLTIASGTNSGQIGAVTLEAPAITLTDHGTITSTTASNSNAGDIRVTGVDIRLEDGSLIRTNTEQKSGRAGNIVMTASDSIEISGISSLQSISLSPLGGAGGTISMIAADKVIITGGSSISTSSTGPGNAGNISINAGQQFDMRDSSIKTEAAQASGGNINIQAIDQVRLVNSSISTSVLGGSGGGGNISIDPNVVVLQNSQILAQAIQGAGGNITIFTPLFLADSSSLVSASSQFGLNGTVTIQSPTSNLSGGLGPLTSKPSQAQNLVTQRCAALANGQASSFVIAGREQLPADPGGWLTSPLALAGLDTDPFNNETVAKGTSNLEPRTSSLSASDRVSLRRLTPSGFLIANFADSEATGCHS